MADCYIVQYFDPPDQRNNMDINITPTTGQYLALLDIILWPELIVLTLKAFTGIFDSLYKIPKVWFEFNMLVYLGVWL